MQAIMKKFPKIKTVIPDKQKSLADTKVLEDVT